MIALAGLLAVPTAAFPATYLSPKPAAASPADQRIHVAQNQQQSAAELLVRIQDLEEIIRTLTGRVEGLEFQLTQMQTQLQKMTEDNEFRFQQLEGGAGGKPQAAAPTDGATPSPALPQQQSANPAAPPSAPTDQPPPASPDLPPAAADDQPMDFGLGESNDPLLKGGSDQLGNLSGEDAQGAGENQPLDLSLGSGQISSGDAKAQYDAGYEAMTRGDYQFAADQFQQFISLYPDDPQAPDAVNWLGEALIQRGDYTGAAQVLAEGYTKHRGSKREPDILLRLGVALAGAEQTDVACRTFFKLKHDFPNLAPAFQQRLTEETTKAKCPVT